MKGEILQNESKQGELDENQIEDLLKEYNEAEDEVRKLDIKTRIKNLTGLGNDLDLLFEEDSSIEDITEAFNYKQELIDQYGKLVGQTEGLGEFDIEELNKLVLQAEAVSETNAEEDKENANRLINEVQKDSLENSSVSEDEEFGRGPKKVKKSFYKNSRLSEKEAYDKYVLNLKDKKAPRGYEEKFNPEDIIKKLDELASSDNVQDHDEVAKLIKTLNGEQAALVQHKMSKSLEKKLKEIDAPELMDWPEAKENSGVDGKFDPDEPINIDEESKMDWPDGSKQKAENDEEGSMDWPEAKEKAENDEEGSMDWPEAKENNGVDGKFNLNESINIDEESKMDWPEEKPVKKSSEEPFQEEEANFEVDITEEMKGKERAEKMNNFFEEENKKGLPVKEILAQGAKTVIGSAASIAGIKAFVDVPRYLTQRAAVRGNIMGIGKGKGLEGSIEEFISSWSNKRRGRRKKIENIDSKNHDDVMAEIRDLNRRLKMTKEGSTRNSEQRKLIAKLMYEQRYGEKLSKEKRHEEITIILDDYTTTKITGMQAAKESLNTVCMGTSIASGGATLKLRALMYAGLSVVEKEQEMKKEARREARRDKTKSKKEIEDAGEKVNMLKAIKKGMGETFKDAFAQREGTKKEKWLKGIKAWGNIARFAGITATAVITPGAYGEAIDKAIDAFRDKDTWSDLPNNFTQGSLNRISLGLAGGSTGAVAEQMTEQTEVKTEELIAPDKVEEIKVEAMAMPYQGGGSIWEESKNQLEATLGEADEKMVNRMTQFVVREPERYGLPQNVDFKSMSAEEIKKIDWNKALGDAISNDELPKVEVADAELVEDNVTDSENNLENDPDRPRNKVLKDIEAEPERVEVRDFYNPDGTVNYEEYFQTEEGLEEARHLNELANKYYEATHNRTNPMPRNLAFEELKREVGELEKKIGYKVSFDKDDNVFVHDDNGRHVVFNANEDISDSKLALKDGEINFDDYEKAKKFLETKEGMKKINKFSELSKKMNEGDLSASQGRRLLNRSIKLRSELEEKTGMGFYDEPNGDIIISKDYKYTKIFDGKSEKLTDITSLKSVDNFTPESDIATFDSDNDFDEKDVVDGKEGVVKDELANDESEALVVDNENLVAKELSEKLNNNPQEIIDEVKPIFAEKYTMLEQENLTKYVNSEIEERNELLKLIDEYKNEYGDRPQFSAFRKMAEGQVETHNGQISKMLKGFSDSEKDYSAYVSSVGGGNPKMMAESLMEIYSRKSGLLSNQELADKAFDELEKRASSR